MSVPGCVVDEGDLQCRVLVGDCGSFLGWGGIGDGKRRRHGTWRSSYVHFSDQKLARVEWVVRHYLYYINSLCSGGFTETADMQCQPLQRPDQVRPTHVCSLIPILHYLYYISSLCSGGYETTDIRWSDLVWCVLESRH